MPIYRDGMSRFQHPTDDSEPGELHGRHGDGLAADLPMILASSRPTRLIGRRQLLLGGLASLGAMSLLAACGSGSGTATGTTPSTTGSSTPPSDANPDGVRGTPPGAPPGGPGGGAPGGSGSSTAAQTGGEIPSETGGPYPGDGTNGPNVLTESGIVRQDIRTSFGQFSGAANGVETTIDLRLVDVTTAEPIPNAAVYLWHCDQGGNYSLYTAADQNYLRGVQVSDGDGNVSFTSIFPGCYSGRWPHAHFEVYSSIDEAVVGTNATKITQLAFPQETCEVVYATPGYEASIPNLSQISLDTDNVFSDGTANEMVSMSGSVAGGLTATLEVRL